MYAERYFKARNENVTKLTWSRTEALLGIKSRRLCRLQIVYRLDGHAESLSHPGREIVNRLTANPQLMGDAGIRRALH
jgi:hypothetical protein